MQLTLVGHASVVLDAGPVSILTDPWVVGDAFNESWTPHPTPVLPDEVLARVTHLFVSHEHPDHLSIPTLRAIPEERRRQLTVLYQRHWSPEVADWLRGLGFGEVRELPHGVLTDLGGGVRVRLFQLGHEDAGLAVHHGGQTVFNLNDGKPSVRTMQRIRRALGPIDVLLSQFSGAGWPGNPWDTERLEASPRRALRSLVQQADTLRPRWVVPFASFVRFSHEENAFMNGALNRMDAVVAAVGADRTAVLAPGDTWQVGDPHVGVAALDALVDAVDRIPDLPLRRHDPVPFGDVVVAAEGHVDRLRSDYHGVLLGRVGRVTFDLTDLGRALTLDLLAGTAVEAAPGAAPGRVELSSQAAHHTFRFRWGVPTLLISGRLRLPDGEDAFRRYKQLGSAWSGGFRTRGLVRSLPEPRHRDLATRRWRELTDLLPRPA